MPRSYEELRDAVVDVLLQRDGLPKADQWVTLLNNVALAFYWRTTGRRDQPHNVPRLPREEAEMVRDVFWNLFRQGYLNIGMDENNPSWPFFSLSHFGRSALAEGTPYRFVDTTTYLAMVRAAVPNLDEVTALYLNEAAQAFYAGCLMSSGVMLGVALENRFLLFLEDIVESERHGTLFRAASQERHILPKIRKFQGSLRSIEGTLPAKVRENLDTQLHAIQSMIRTFRNESGHPTGKVPMREQTYVNLQMFAPCAGKLFELQQELT